MASLAVGAELFAVELSAILRLILVVGTNLLLAQMIVLIVLAKLLYSVSVLAFGTIATETCLRPILAHLTLVH